MFFFQQPHRTFIEQHWLMYSLILDFKKTENKHAGPVGSLVCICYILHTVPLADMLLHGVYTDSLSCSRSS